MYDILLYIMKKLKVNRFSVENYPPPPEVIAFERMLSAFTFPTCIISGFCYKDLTFKR